MKKIKHGLCLSLVIALLIQIGTPALATESSEQIERSEDGVLYTYNDDGTVTATIYTFPVVQEKRTASIEVDRLEDLGDSYVNTAEDVTVTLGKVYTEGEMLASVTCDGTGIVFYPETNPGIAPGENDVEEPPAIQSGTEGDSDAQAEPSTVDEVTTEESTEGDESRSFEASESEEPGDIISESPEEAATEDGESADLNEPDEQSEQTTVAEIPAEEESAGDTESADSTDTDEQTEQTTVAEISAEEDVAGDTASAGSADTDEQMESSDSEEFSSEHVSEADERPEADASEQTEEAEAAAEATEEENQPDSQERSRRMEEPETEWDVAQVYDSVAGVGTGYKDGTYSGVHYPGAINEYTDVDLILQDNGVKENIVMRRYTTSEISYVLDFDGLSPVQSGNAIFLYDASSVKVGEISAPYLLDANGVYNDGIEVSLCREGSEYHLVYTLDEEWLLEATYPVVLDPSVTFTVPGDTWNYIEDNYVTLSQPSVNHDYRNASMRCNSDNIPYIRPVFPDSIKQLGNSLLIKNVTMYTYILNVYSAGTFSAHPVLGGDWRSTTITAGTAPSFGASIQDKNISSTGYVAWDITEAASTWFNALDQRANYGIAITGTGDINIHSSDDWTNLLYYEITYYPVAQSNPKDPNLQVAAHGNALNSGTGYLDLSWSAVEGASNYYVGIHNGKEYEYFYVRGATSWMTRGKGIWPTDAEISRGRYRLHQDGAGAELPMIPALSYNNSGGELAGNLRYSVCVIPANAYGQAPNPAHYGVKTARLPDRLAPSAASSVTISPSGYTKANSITVTWNGIQDYNDTAANAVTSLGSGHVQYSINDTNHWTNTSSSSGSGSATVDVSRVSDGQNVLYLRGVDSAGNTGTYTYALFYIDRSGPSAPTVSINPSAWSNAQNAVFSWNGFSDVNSLSRVEYAVDGGTYKDTGENSASFEGYSIDTRALADGVHTLSLRAVDSLGNVGSATTVRFYIDRTRPGAPTVSVVPGSWNNDRTAKISWSGIVEANGISRVEYAIDDGAYMSTGKNAASFSGYEIDTSALTDGIHLLRLRAIDAAGNTGTAGSVYLYIDRSGPTAPELSVIPRTWSREDIASVTWNAIRDICGLSRVEYAIDDGAYVSTGVSEEAYANYALDISALEDGEHVLRIRAVDELGNVGETTEIHFYRDTTEPRIQSISLDPDSWTSSDSVRFGWTGLVDAHSGVKTVWYSVDGGEEVALEIEEELTTELDVSALEDGEHSITLHFEDAAGNILEETLTVFRDTTEPELEMQIPEDGSAVNGVVEIWGSVQDLSLDGWQVLAIGADGEERVLETGTEAKDAARLAVFNCAGYADGEQLELKIRAWDKAGNESERSGTVVVVDKSARPLSATVSITAPENGTQISDKQILGAYRIESEAEEERSLLYIDGVFAGETTEGVFPFDAIRYAENSSHSFSILSLTEDGALRFSEGLSSFVWLSDVFADESYLSASEGVTLGAGARLSDGAAAGRLVSQVIALPLPVQSIRLSVTENKPSGSSIVYFYSTDGGESWTTIVPETDVPLLFAPETLLFKAELTAGGEVSPILHGWTIQSSVESAPLRVSVRLLRPVETIGLANTTVRQALTLLADTPEDAALLAQYVDGRRVSESFVYDARLDADGALHQVVLLAETSNGVLCGTGAKTEILLRENPMSSETVQTVALQGAGALYALRLEALYTGDVRFSWSADGETWKELTEGDYCLLDEAAEQVYLRAEIRGGTLESWHLEGVSCTSSRITTAILSAPRDVQATDWGEYYEDEEERRYDLRWTDPTPEDSSAENSTEYEIYRNGRRIASTTATRFVDGDYVPGARYEVRTVRSYGDGFVRHVSAQSAATVTVVPAPEKPEQPVAPDVPEEEHPDEPQEVETPDIPDAPEEAPAPAPRTPVAAPQDASIYAGSHEFNDEERAAIDQRALDMSLLGRNKLCAYGFEPVNFNTGNFLLEAEDYTLADLGLAFFALDRTYNSRSDTEGGSFGADWSSTWSEHLLLYAAGDVTYTEADGAEIVFLRRADGSYTGGESRGLTLTADGGEYRVTDLNGEIHAFTGMGLLKHVQWSDGNRIELLRDAGGKLMAFVLPSGLALPVEHDASGHITAIETPAGTLRYAYRGDLLESFTDTDGSEIRYAYDAQGRMIEWYDAAGVCQVKNTYDEQNRVIRQLDALGGEYAMEYFDDHTVTTDADGNTSEVWFDALKRTTKTVDAEGAVVSYSYDANSNIIAITDALGNTTRYEYDAFGNKVKEIAPDGSSYSLQYDANNNLAQLTDPRGGVTRYEYDENNRLVRQINPDGGVIAYTYNEAGQVLTVTDPLGNVTAYEYDGVDLIRSVDPNGNITTYAYDGRRRLVSTTDALGNTTFFSYDGQDNLISVTFADDTSFTYEYDAVGNLVSQTDALGNTTRFEYDALRQLVKTIYPDGSEATSAYDHSGNLIAAVDAAGGEATAAYDGRGRISTLTDALGCATTYAYDPCGNLISQSLANGAETVYAYDANGRLTSVTVPTGETTRYAYDAAGNLVSVTAPDGGMTRYGYDEMGRLISETDPLGAVTTYAYDAAGRLSTRTDANGGVTAYAFDANGNLLTITDALGGVTSYTYDALNRVVSMTDANGATTTYAYDAVGNLISQTDALGNTTAYAYDANGSITGLTDALGGKSAMTYDELGNVIAVLQKNGGRVSAEYDPLGRLLAEADALGNVTAYEYDANGRVTRITDALGQSAEIAYDATGNVTSIHAPGGGVTTYAYDLAGRLIGETSPIGAVTRYTYSGARLTATIINGNETRFTYDLAGNITSVTDAEGRRIELRYDALGNLTAVLYPDGTQDAYEYDALSRLVRYVPRLGDATEYTYNAMGDVLAVTVGGQTTRYEYDLLGRVIATVTADGARTELSYDALGNLTKTVDALGNEMTYAYTADSLLEAVTYANGATLTASYDLLGNLTSETDPVGAVTAYEYDPLGRLTAVTDALGCTTRYAYDAADRLTKVTDALGHVTRYTYDANGNLTSETDALGNTVRYSYTPEGWLETVTDAEGHITRYTYDRTGSVLTADYAGEQFETNAYNELGLLTTVTTAEGDTLYQYDEAGRLISVTQPNGETVSYTYDSHGNRTSMTYPDGKTVSYTYDEMNRLVAVKGVDGKTTRYSYDALGRRIATDGVKEDTVYVYDAVGNLVSQTTTGKLELSFEYVYDLAGRMTQESRTENGATLISSYLYDALGQLTSFTRSDGLSETYTYDPVGNMTAKTQGGVSTAMRYNAANQLTQSVTNGDTTTYTYDANGSLLRSENAGGARSYAYNALGLLSQFIREDGYTETYFYNANRLLSSITTGEDLTTTLTWDTLYGEGVVIGAAQNGQATSYTYGLERISALSGKIRTEYAYDGRGSVAAEISYNTAWYTFGGLLARKNVTSKSYSPFGELLTEQASGFGYNGEYYSAATGMIYLRARFYAPEMNRFGQKDLLRGNIIDGLSLNRYTYCANDPVNFIDPSGMALARNNMVLMSDGGGSFRSSQTYKNYLVEGQRLVNEAKQAMRQAEAAWHEAEAYAPGSQAAQTAMNAWKQAKAAATRASSNYSSLQSAGSLSAANTAISSIRSAASTARNAASDARTCADRATGNRIANKLIYTGDASSPSVESESASACIKYNREAVVDYVKQYAYSTNPDYLPFGSFSFAVWYFWEYRVWTGMADCANFVSQCLVAGNIQQTDDWHFKKIVNELAPWLYQLFTEKTWFHDADGNLTPNAVAYDFTSSWTVASAQFYYFGNIDNGYTSTAPIYISSADQIEETLEQYDVQPGDLLYWVNSNGNVHHATIISSVDGTDITFAGHTSPADFKPLYETMISNGEAVYIVLMNDYMEVKNDN